MSSTLSASWIRDTGTSDNLMIVYVFSLPSLP